MRKQPLLPRTELRQAILKCLIVGSASLTLAIGASPSIAEDIIFSEELKTCDFIYGVNDDLLNNSQLFKINPNTYEMESLGPAYDGYDLEALDVSTSGEVYVASGDNTADVSKAGYLYKIDPGTGVLTEVCPTGFAEIDGLSFNPQTNTLYGWAQDAGLIKINLLEEGCDAQLIYESLGEVEDLTWSNDGTRLYVVKNEHGNYTHPSPYTADMATYRPDPENDGSVPHNLIAYQVVADVVTAAPVCEQEISSLGEIESLEINTTDLLLIGYHSSNNKSMIATLDPVTCEISTQSIPTYPSEVENIPFGDIEAIGVCPCINPPETDWEYAYDPPRDATGLRALEIFGIAVKVKGNTILVAINANMPATGVNVSAELTGPRKVVDGNIAYADMTFYFANGSQNAVHFSPGNDSSVTELGLYTNVESMDVTKQNYGHTKLVNYLAVLGDITATMGDLGFPTPIFPMNTPRGLDMSIAAGTRVPGDNFQELSAADLQAEGLNFAKGLGTNKLGSETFGFSFTKQMNMHGDFIATLITECSNDHIAIIGTLPDCPDDDNEDDDNDD